MKSIDHSHPRPARYQLEQRLIMALLLAVVLGFAGQMLLAVLLRGFLFGLGALTILAFTPFLLMTLSTTPPMQSTEKGLVIQPHWWRERLIPWEDIREVRHYPLLPRADQETERRAMQGRKRYVPADGRMLIVPSLPWQYRAAGFFAGAGGQPIIAVTNRTHTHYEQLIQRLETATTPIV